MNPNPNPEALHRKRPNMSEETKITKQQIANRKAMAAMNEEQQKSNLLASLKSKAESELAPLAVAVEQPKPGAFSQALAPFAQATGQAKASQDADRRARVAAVIEPVERAVREVLATYKRLRAEYFDRAVDVAQMDVKLVLKAVPEVAVVGQAQTNHATIVMFHRLAEQLFGALNMSADYVFPDLRAAMQELRGVAEVKDADDRDFKAAVIKVAGVTLGQPQGWLLRAQEGVSATEGLAKMFATQEPVVIAMLSGLDAAQFKLDPAPKTYPVDDPGAVRGGTPSRSTGMTDYEPRAIFRESAKESVVIDGVKPGVGRDVKVVG